MSEYLSRVNNLLRDDKQKEVFLKDESRVVLAGPGSGKTYLLTSKVAKLILEGTVRPPHKIACLTYSRLLELQLQEDLGRLGVLDNERLFVGTVHSFCLSEIIFPFRHLYQLKLPDPLRIASWNEMIEALGIALKKQSRFLPPRRRDQEDLMRDLSKYRKLYFEVNQKRSISHFPEMQSPFPAPDWLKLTQDYMRILLDGNDTRPPSVDFVEIERLTLLTIQQHELVQKCLAAKYPWWVIDEYQDLGRPFHQMMVCLLQKTDIDIFAIGDPHQCIYEQVQGSKPEYLYDLIKQVEKVKGNKYIELQTNYRSSQEIIDISESLLNQKRGHKSNTHKKGQSFSVRFPSRNHISLLPSLLNNFLNRDSLPLSEIAILAPKRKYLAKIENVLTKNGWSCVLDKEPEYVRLTITGWIENLAKWCVSGFARPHLYELLPVWLLLNEQTSVESGRNIFFWEQQLFAEMLPLCEPNMSLQLWLSKVVERLELFRLINRFGELYPDEALEFRRLFEATQNKNTRISSWTLEQFARIGSRIQLTTLHSSKGCQYDTVIIYGFDDLPFGGPTPKELDYRLVYVAASRAKTTLYLTHSSESAFFVKKLNQLNSLVINLDFFPESHQFLPVPNCPRCSSKMVIRIAKRGFNKGNKFWGCSNYPRCKGIVSLSYKT